jgi:DNA polymerase III subunit delta'
MGFSEFLGNERIVQALRTMLRREHVPNALLFVGPRGIGKFTLARMFAQAANCERLRPPQQAGDDFCGECDTCKKIARLADPGPLIEQGLAERGESLDTAAVERMPLILETHPDVWAIVPDPVRRKNPVARPMIRMGQLRAVQRAAYFRPQARRRIFVMDGAETMRWNDADVFLKILEEPPETATLILLAPRADALLQTIRSRCLTFWFAPMAPAQIEGLLKGRSEWKAAERKLAAQLADGSPGAALGLDLAESSRLRREVLRLIADAMDGKSHHAIFAATTRLAKEESESFENVLGLFYSLLADLLELSHKTKNFAPRNPDLRRELESLANRVTDAWVARATDSLDQLEGRLRRNVGRQLGLDAVAESLRIG